MKLVKLLQLMKLMRPKKLIRVQEAHVIIFKPFNLKTNG